MIRTDLADRAKQISQHLSQAVTELVPEGIGRWQGAWDMVAEASADFMLALAIWEADPTDESAAAVKLAYEAVLKAWRLAIRQYVLHTRPNSTLADEDHQPLQEEANHENADKP